MKTFYSAMLLIVATTVLCSCISRTVSSISVDPTSGMQTQGKVLEKKTVWVWEKEFRNP